LDWTSQTDEQLMRHYGAGEYGAFEELYQRHSGRIYAYLKSRTRQPGEAEDLLQVVFMKIHRYREGYDTTLPFLPWVFSITRHALIDHVRKHRETLVESEELTRLADRKAETPPPPPRRSADWEAVVKLLPDDQRRLLELRFTEGLSFDEIAEQLRVSPVSARKRVSRTIQGLRRRLTGKGDES
jgi:RNA polymerase sigma-70 factor (ECF subfamily)